MSALRSVGAPYELRPTDLAARLLLTSGGVSNILNQLEHAGLAGRAGDSTDGRCCWVKLTGAGVKIAGAALRPGPRPRPTSCALSPPNSSVPQQTRSARSSSPSATVNHRPLHQAGASTGAAGALNGSPDGQGDPVHPGRGARTARRCKRHRAVPEQRRPLYRGWFGARERFVFCVATELEVRSAF
jgi:DNA-binding MarR family transcriptional regulator